MVLKEIFCPPADKFNDFMVLKSSIGIFKSHSPLNKEFTSLGRIIILEQAYQIATHGLEYLCLGVIIFLCFGVIFFP